MKTIDTFKFSSEVPFSIFWAGHWRHVDEKLVGVYEPEQDEQYSTCECHWKVEVECQIYGACKVDGISIPYFTSILDEIYRPAITAPAVQHAWPTTVPTVTRYTLCERSLSATEARFKRTDVRVQHPGQW